MSFWLSFAVGFSAIVAIIGIIVGLTFLAGYYDAPRLDMGGFVAGTLLAGVVLITAMLVWVR